MEVLILFLSTLMQNASFTLVSRARNSSSIAFHACAATLSNGIWLLVIRQVVTHLDSWIMMATYLVASVMGSIGMHWFSMHKLEKKLKSNGTK